MTPAMTKITIAATGSPIPNPKLKELLSLCDEVSLIFSAVAFSTVAFSTVATLNVTQHEKTGLMHAKCMCSYYCTYLATFCVSYMCSVN